MLWLLLLLLVSWAQAGAEEIPLKAGWNGVSFSVQRVTELQPNPDVAGFLYYHGPDYRSAPALPEGRRGYWAYAHRDTTLRYSGGDDGQGRSLTLFPGWNLAGFATATPLPCSALSASVDDRTVPLGTVLAPGFFRVASGGYELVDWSSPGATLQAGAAYWIYASSFTRLTWGGPGGTAATRLLVGLDRTDIARGPKLAAFDPATMQALPGSPYEAEADGDLVVDPVSGRLYIPNQVRGLECLALPSFERLLGAPFAYARLRRSAGADPIRKRLYLTTFEGLEVVSTEDHSRLASLPVEDGLLAVAYDPGRDRIYALLEGFGVRLASFDARTLQQVPGSPFTLSDSGFSDSDGQILLDAPLNRLLVASNNLVSAVDLSRDLLPVPGSPLAGYTFAMALDPTHNQVFLTGHTSLRVLDRGSLAVKKTVNVNDSNSVVYHPGTDRVFYTEREVGVHGLDAATLRPLEGSPWRVPGTSFRYLRLALDPPGQPGASPAPVPSPSPTGPAGQTWTLQTAALKPVNLTFGAGKFLAVEAGRAYTSTDGLGWASHPAPFQGPNSVAYGNGRFVVMGRSGADVLNWRSEAYTSADGVSWTALDSPDLKGLGLGSLVTVDAPLATFVALGPGTGPEGFSGSVLSSLDGQVWRRVNHPNRLHDMSAIAFGNGRFVVVGAGGAVRTSTDLVTWNAHPSLGTPFPENLVSLAFGAGRFVTLGGDGKNRAYHSTDGVSWSQVTVSNVHNVSFHNGQFVAVGNTVATSPDGMTWTPRTANLNGPLYRVTFGNGRFVATSAGGIVTSP